jgi:hypothetical protein
LRCWSEQIREWVGRVRTCSCCGKFIRPSRREDTLCEENATLRKLAEAVVEAFVLREPGNEPAIDDLEAYLAARPEETHD